MDIKLGESNKGKSIGVEGKKTEDDVVVIGDRSGGIRTELSNHITIGRIKNTMHLGSGARRKEHLRIINGCKDAMDLKVKLGMMRI